MTLVEGPDGTAFLQPGKVHEAEILAGEASPALNAARRERMKLLTANPQKAEEIAAHIAARGLAAAESPGAVIFALDLLNRTRMDLFVKAASGIARGPVPPTRAAKWQLTTRMMSSLNIAQPGDSFRLAEHMAASTWVRAQVASEANAGRAFLTAMKPVADGTAIATPEQLAAFSRLARDWILPRLKHAQGKGPARSGLPETDWAFSRVLAVQMSRLLKTGNEEGAKAFAGLARELEAVPQAAQYLENERVSSLFAEFGLAK